MMFTELFSALPFMVYPPTTSSSFTVPPVILTMLFETLPFVENPPYKNPLAVPPIMLTLLFSAQVAYPPYMI